MLSGSVLLPTLVLAAQTAGGGSFPRFVEVAAEVGLTATNLSGSPEKNYIVEVNGNGAAFFDYDNDGRLDVLVANGSSLEALESGGTPMAGLYRGDGTAFTDVTGTAGLETRGWGMGVCVADYDNDGDRDAYLTAYGPNVMYRNNGDGTFTDVTASSGTGDSHWSTNCAFGDYDRDGDVDLYVANYLTFDVNTVPRRGESEDCQYMGQRVICGPLGLAGDPDTLYRNNGDGTFTDVTRTAGINDPGSFGFGVLFSDFDGDGWPDIYVANDSVPNFLFRNNKDGTFSEFGLISGTSLSGGGLAQAGMGVDAADYDGDGDYDIFVTNFIQDTNTLYENRGNLLFQDVTQAVGLGEVSLGYMGWGTGFADLDNDGWPDLFIVNGHVIPQIDSFRVGQHYAQGSEVYRNLGGERFADVRQATGGDLSIAHSTRGVAFGDYDSDGDIDALAINMDEPPSLYRNDGGNQAAWISFQLEGTRSNRDAIGARVEVDAGGRTRVQEIRSGSSYLSHNDMRAHFGLGDTSRIDAVRVFWPDGSVEDLGSFDARQFLTIREGEGVVAAARPASD